MTTRNEITDLLCAELEKYGLRGKVEDRSKHLAVVFNLPNGESRFIIAPKTPGDWRGGMNARSDLRRMLRDNNVPLHQESPTSFQHAMSLPKESPVTHAARERALQKDVETLSELIFELHEQNSTLIQQIGTMVEKLNSLQVVSTVMSNVSFTGQQVVEERKTRAPTGHRRNKIDEREMLQHIGFAWTRAKDILDNAGHARGTVYKLLKRLLEQGLVETLHGQWRRKNDNIVVLGSGSQS